MIPQITIPDDAWEPNDGLADPRSRLLTTIEINGLSMHLEAWEVGYGCDACDFKGYDEAADTCRECEGMQHPLAVEDDGDYEHLYQAVTADGSFRTVAIAGREYILVASPYC